jgi:hypothetical protein
MIVESMDDEMNHMEGSVCWNGNEQRYCSVLNEVSTVQLLLHSQGPNHGMNDEARLSMAGVLEDGVA